MTIDLVLTATKFINAYREVEKGAPKKAEDIINYLEKHKPTAQHLCSSWRGRKQDWGSFYLNLSHKFQHKILKFWGLADPAGEEYAHQVEESPAKMLFADVPDSIIWPHELLKFFNNHGIDEIPETGITLSSLPPDDRRYGNSANWGDYVLALPAAEREQLLHQIAAYSLERRS
ncbi:hypothetical protein [Chitinophaga tropicalis]|uniref:Uncharacterized protein n=1 Tax=Chitinophaga tropicalis TaxID=2683588 RepID=A0A7K1UDV6_9BACT|nr:hypothetical protein [Chitinophaga tropicalis]MVT12496.1 hypothetical protein [Chitinophaga tropicalis]